MISIYVHWPFCLSKCPYCDFNSHVSTSFDWEAWKKLYVKEIDHFSSYILGKRIRSIFFGGGTPSLMSPALVGSVIDKITSLGILDEETEISLEANPNSVESKKFKDFAQSGINRISIGIQSLNQTRLQFLGRKHGVEEALNAIQIAKNYFKNVSCDLIYACYGQTIKEWDLELQQILDFRLNHLSLYQLTIEENTKFHTLAQFGKLPLLCSEISSDLYEFTDYKLLEFGYKRYEISNYALQESFMCLHNLNYWNYGSYVGIGPGAHGRLEEEEGIIAIEMQKNPKIWMEQVAAKGHATNQECKLTQTEIVTEILFMGLRINCGVPLGKIEKVMQRDLQSKILEPKFQFLIDKEFVAYSNNSISLTNKGMLLHTELTSQIVDIFTEGLSL